MRNLAFFFFFFIFLIIPLIHSVNVNCPISNCGSNIFFIKYPFKLQGERPQLCSDYVNLTCTSQNNTILNLPFSGEFYVDDILYYNKSIFLYDPEDCLAKRLMSLNLSSSPFSAIKYENYTFYNCPFTRNLIYDGFTPIECLSNYPNATVASSNMSPGDMMRSYGCSANVTVRIPAEESDQFDGLGIFTNLKLTWDVPSCNDCEESDTQEPEQDKPRSKISRLFGSSIFLGISVLACLMIVIAARNPTDMTTTSTTREEVAMAPETTTSTSTMQPESAGGGATASPDEYYLKTMTISTFLEGNFGPLESHDQGTSCIICLEEYSPQDIIGCLNLCHHYFHAKCIDQWLKTNSSCPVCRTSILDVKL